MHLLVPYQVVDKLRYEGTSGNFIHVYIGGLNERWYEDISRELPSWSPLQKACVDAVEAVILLTQNTRTDIQIATHECIGSLISLARCASRLERDLLLRQMMRHRLLDILLDKLANHELCLHRCMALEVLRSMAGNLTLGAELSPQKTADTMEKCLDWILAGPEAIVQELLDPRKTWQSQMMLGKYSVPPAAASKYGYRHYYLTQENAIWAAHFLVLRSPLPSRQFFLDAVHHNPILIDKLLDCANLPLPESYPESCVDGFACETLAIFCQFPLRSVPGLSFPMDGAFKADHEKEHDATITVLQLILSRPMWRSKLLGVWTKIENTLYQDIFRFFRIAKDEYYATVLPDGETYETVANTRGQCRIMFLRLVASLALVDDIQTPDILSFLRPSYLSTQKLKPLNATSSITDRLLHIEREEEICRSPPSVSDRPEIEPMGQVPHELIMGPIALLRLLLRLAQRGLLEEAQTWNELPMGCEPSTSLVQVKQITSPAVLKKLLSLSVKRVTARRKLGLERARRGDHRHAWFARSAYVPAAELASILVQFDETTHSRYSDSIRGARKELVLCLDLAAGVSMRIQEYESALGFSLGEVAAIEDASLADEIPSDMLPKAKRRIADAKRQLRN